MEHDHPRGRLGFAPGDWNVVQTPLAAQLAQNVQVAWATNRPLAGDDAATGWPNNTARALGDGGILVYASLAQAVDNPEEYADLNLPLTLASGTFAPGQYEDQPASNVSVNVISARVRGHYLLIYVYFGTNQPSPQLRQQAEGQLARLVVPQAAPAHA